MALVLFNPNEKIHQDLFEDFKQDLISDIYSKDHLFARFDNYIDEIDLIFRHIAVEELGLEPDISEYESYWQAAIYNNNPTHFGVIVGLEYIDMPSENPMIEFIKVAGNIFVEDDKLIILDIDASDVDYSSNKEFTRAKQTESFRK